MQLDIATAKLQSPVWKTRCKIFCDPKRFIVSIQILVKFEKVLRLARFIATTFCSFDSPFDVSLILHNLSVISETKIDIQMLFNIGFFLIPYVQYGYFMWIAETSKSIAHLP